MSVIYCSLFSLCLSIMHAGTLVYNFFKQEKRTRTFLFILRLNGHYLYQKNYITLENQLVCHNFWRYLNHIFFRIFKQIRKFFSNFIFVGIEKLHFYYSPISSICLIRQTKNEWSSFIGCSDRSPIMAGISSTLSATCLLYTFFDD